MKRCEFCEKSNSDSSCSFNRFTISGYGKEYYCEKAIDKMSAGRTKGYWRAIYQGDEIIDYRCTECEFGSTFGKGIYGMNYCPCCGAEMIGVIT